MAGAIYSYTFSTATVAPPSNKQLRLDQALYSLATRLWADNETSDNANIHDGLLQLPLGTELVLQEAGVHANLVRFLVTAAVIDQTTFVAIPISFQEQQGTAFANNIDVEWLIYATLPPPTVLLVSLATAKQHLRITDALHDADIELKLTQAQHAILDYLAEVVDETWTEATVPRIVEAAILIYLTHLYEHRGDDMSPSASGSTPDEDVWAAIRRLLARLRMQAIGVGAVTG